MTDFDTTETELLVKLREAAQGKPLAVIAIDLETGEQGVKFTDDYCLITREPYYLAYEAQHANGTTALTVKRREEADDAEAADAR